MLQPIPYVIFNGNCLEAVHFYEKALGARLEKVVRFADMDCSAPAAPEHGQRIAHARLALDGGGMLFAGDCPASMPYDGIRGVSLSLGYGTAELAQKVFAALSDGGQVTMPMQDTMWAKAAGMVKDRYGVDWIINGAMKEV